MTGWRLSVFLAGLWLYGNSLIVVATPSAETHIYALQYVMISDGKEFESMRALNPKRVHCLYGKPEPRKSKRFCWGTIDIRPAFGDSDIQDFLDP